MKIGFIGLGLIGGSIARLSVIFIQIQRSSPTPAPVLLWSRQWLTE